MKYTILFKNLLLAPCEITVLAAIMKASLFCFSLFFNLTILSYFSPDCNKHVDGNKVLKLNALDWLKNLIS